MFDIILFFILIDFNGMSTHLELINTESLWNCMLIFTFFV